MLRTVHLHNELADKFGAIHKFQIDTPQEAIRALHANIPGFLRSIRRDGNYAVVIGKDFARSLTDKFQFQYTLKDNENDIHIIPVIEGAGGGNKGVFGVILGVVLIATAWFNPGNLLLASGMAAGSSILPITTATVGLMGATMILGGISSMLAIPATTDYSAAETPENRPSYMFNSTVNRAEQGGALPIIYGGPLMVGSVVVASGVVVTQTGSDSKEDENETGGTTPSGGDLKCVIHVKRYLWRMAQSSTANYIFENSADCYAIKGYNWVHTEYASTCGGSIIDYYSFNGGQLWSIDDSSYTTNEAIDSYVNEAAFYCHI